MKTICRASMLAAAFVLLFSALPGGAGQAAAADPRLERLEKEIIEIRKENEGLRERVDELEADKEESRYSLQEISRVVNVSGYADVEYRHTTEEGENDGFRVRHLSLFFDKDVQDEWGLFSEIEYEDAPLFESARTTDTIGTAQGKLYVEQMYIEYHPRVTWDLRFGRYLTPAGIWNIYHYYPYVPTQERPMMVRNIFPQAADGIQFRGSMQVLGSGLDTHLYIANGAGNPGRLDRNEKKAFGARLNYSANVLGGLEIGTSFYRESDNQDVRRTSYGAHLLLTRSAFKLQSEIARRHNEPSAASDYNDTGFYAQVSYDIDRWTLAGRYDWYDENDSISNLDRFRYTGAVNYHFAHNVVGKAELNHNNFRDGVSKDYNEVIFAIVVAIGNL